MDKRLNGRLANVSNPMATALARAINRNGDARQQVKDAIVDAQLHRDWRAVSAIENSLEREEDRAIARHLGYVGTRALVVSRVDAGELAARIPGGSEYGVLWMVCLVYLRVNGDIETGFAIAEQFHSRVVAQGGYGVDWGIAPMCLPPLAFGGPTRVMVTETVAQGHTDTLHQVQDYAMETLEAQVASSRTQDDRHSIAFIVWGTVVTESHAPIEDLFNEDRWCPGLDRQAIAPPLTKLLAEVASEFDEETYIHPDILSATEANDFARGMVNEQTIDDVVNDVVKPRLGESMTGASVRITKIMPKSLPYMDQLLIGFWGRANILLQTFLIPRSGRPLDEDAERIAQMCRSRGIHDVRLVDLVKPIHADAGWGHAVSLSGELIPSSKGGMGDAASLIQDIGWEDPADAYDAEMEGIQSLPMVLQLERLGALSCLGNHYTPTCWAQIKQALTQPGDPIELISRALGGCWAGSPDDLSWLLKIYKNMMLPLRDVALAVQFKQMQGAIIKVTPALIEVLGKTDIGADCPAMYLQGGFNPMYITLGTPTVDLGDVNAQDDRCILDGVMVQRWEQDGQQHLLLDAFLTESRDEDLSTQIIGAEPLALTLEEGCTLGDLRAQVAQDNRLQHQVLDLFSGVMLYMNARDSRVVRKDEHAEAAAVIATLNRKKRRKEHYRKLNASVNAIHVGPETAGVEFNNHQATQSRNGVKPHYRRGFVRFGQRVGKGRTETRPVFIPPVLVNAHKLLSSTSEKKHYIVGASK